MDVLARTALGLDGATFAALWAKAHGISDGLRGARPVAKDILRDPNWFVLGAVSRCTATVVTPDGKEYRFSSFANELSSADVGREVPMTAYRTRSGKPTTTFYPSKQLAQNDLGMLLGFFGSAVLAIGGPIACGRAAASHWTALRSTPRFATSSAARPTASRAPTTDDRSGFGTLEPPDGRTRVDDSSKVGRHARAVLAAAKAFRAEAAEVRAEPDQLLALAAAKFQAVRDSLVADQLRAMPLDKLRDTKANLRLSKLKAAGYRTVADVAKARPEQLDGVPGVGRQSAEQIVRVARAVVDGVARDTTVRLNPDRADRAQTELLQLMSKLRRANQLVDPLREPLGDVLGRVDADVRAASRAWSRVRMFFSSRKNRQAAIDSLDRLEALLASRDVAALRAVGTQLRVPDLDHRALWRDYELDAAAYNTLLADLAGADAMPDRSAAKGFVPADIEHEVDATTLDTSLLKVSLRGYQVFGAKFALARKRVIIGDEMGLGKTIEAIAVMAGLAAGGRRGFLVVCPASVVVNWVNEIARHSDLVPHRMHGAGRDGAVGKWLAQGGVGVTTFGTLPKLVLPKRFRPALVVVDEAHYVKNPDTQRSQAVNTIVQRAERAVLLTGTPMENRVEEFRNLVAYLQPGVAARTGATDAVVGAKAFRRVVAPVYLRRNQEDVLGELPELLEMEDWVEFGKQDRSAYLDAVREGNLMAMRRAAYAPGTPRGSAKLERLLEIIEESRDNGWKVVVFSYFHDVLDAVADHLEVFGPLTGATSAQGRQQLVDAFTACEDHAVLVAQIEAGGVGLNIQAASVVIIAEPQWKPSTEDQAIARCHRMGQVRKVHVHRLLVKDSVDARVQEIRDHKTLLFGHYARESDTKHSHASALDSAVSVEQRVVQAEQQRLGL